MSARSIHLTPDEPSSFGADPGAPRAAYRDDREALRARVADLEAELAEFRSGSELERLRAELAAAKRTISALIRAKLVSRGVQAEGAPRVLTWHFCVRNTGTTTIRLLAGQTIWCIEQQASGAESLIALLDAPVESTFGSQPELEPGRTSDEYKLKLDTALPALRARVKHLGLASRT